MLIATAAVGLSQAAWQGLNGLVAGIYTGNPGVNPNTNGLPGVSWAKNMAGALLTYALIAAVAGIALSGIFWVLGNHSNNPQTASRGKVGVLACAAVSVLVGGADAIVTFFSNAGTTAFH